MPETKKPETKREEFRRYLGNYKFFDQAHFYFFFNFKLFFQIKLGSLIF